MRIVHFSDIHAFQPPSGVRPWLDKRLLGTFNHVFRRRRHHDWSRLERAVARIRLLRPDLVLLTGDISTISNPREFEQSLEALDPLVQDSGLELIYVPGNHDHYTHCAASVAALHRAFGILNRQRWSIDDLPVMHNVGFLRLIMVNQACPAPPWGSWGRLSPAAVTRLRTMLADRHLRDDHHRVALVQHFPLFNRHGLPERSRRACHDNEVLVEAFKDGRIDLAFCGHIHQPYVRWESHGSAEFCGGSLTNTGLFNLIEFDPKTNRIAHEWVDVDRASAATGAAVGTAVASSARAGAIMSDG